MLIAEDADAMAPLEVDDLILFCVLLPLEILSPDLSTVRLQPFEASAILRAGCCTRHECAIEAQNEE